MKIHFKYLLFIVVFGMSSSSFAGQGGYMYFLNHADPWSKRNIGIGFSTINDTCLNGGGSNLWPNEIYYIETNNEILNGCAFEKDTRFDIVVADNENKIGQYRIVMSQNSSLGIYAKEDLSPKDDQMNTHYWHHSDFGAHGFSFLGIFNTQDYLLVSASAKAPVVGWMGQIFNHLKDKPLNHIILPGSHNSATSDLGIEISPDRDSELKFLPEQTLGSFGLNKQLQFSKTQTYTVSEQLERGIRYLDLRLCFDGAVFKACHGTFSNDQSLKRIFEQVKNFLSHPENSKEIVIIDIKKVFDWDKLSSQARDKFNKSVEDSGLDKFALQKETLKPISLYHEFLDRGYQVIILHNDSDSKFMLEREDNICTMQTDSSDKNKIWSFFKKSIVNRADDCQNKFMQSQLFGKITNFSKDLIDSNLSDFNTPIKMFLYNELINNLAENWLKSNGNIITENFTSGFDLALIAKDLNSNNVTVRIQKAINDGNFGSWAMLSSLSQSSCNSNEYVGAFTVRNEKCQGDGDDTALNAVRMQCFQFNSGGNQRTLMREIFSSEGKWGDWATNWSTCSRGPVNGFQMQIESSQGSDDDTAVNGIKMSCLNGEWLTSYKPNNWGSWREPSICPVGFALVGFVSRVEADQGGGDDTAFNGMRGYCKAYPF